MELARLMQQDGARDYRADVDTMPTIDRLAAGAGWDGVYCFGLEYQAGQIYRQLHSMGAIKGSLKHEI